MNKKPIDSEFRENLKRVKVIKPQKSNNKKIDNESVAPTALDSLGNEDGKIGYLVAWLVGVPAWVLLILFMVKG